MLIVDDVLFFPFRGLFFILREIHKAAEAGQHDSQSIVQQLQQLYMQLETGKISEEEFNQQEAVLLARLEQTERGSRQ